MTAFSEHLAEEILELRVALKAARRRIRDLERSRDLWKQRYEYERGAQARHRAALTCFRWRESRGSKRV